MQNDYLKIRIDKDLYVKFQEICKIKRKTISEVLRFFINSYTNSKNVILLDIDNETLHETLDLCKEKKIKFDDLMKFLLKKAIKNKDKINFN